MHATSLTTQVGERPPFPTKSTHTSQTGLPLARYGDTPPLNKRLALREWTLPWLGGAGGEGLGPGRAVEVGSAPPGLSLPKSGEVSSAKEIWWLLPKEWKQLPLQLVTHGCRLFWTHFIVENFEQDPKCRE